LESACLFNIKEDPCEQRNLAESRPMILATLKEALLKYRVTAIPPSNVANDPRANPALWNGTWISWLDDDPLESLVDDVNKDRLDDPTPKLTGPVIAVIAIIFGLSLLGILTFVALGCSREYSKLKKKQQQSAYRNST
jgi:hypothetical protein